MVIHITPQLAWESASMKNCHLKVLIKVGVLAALLLPSHFYAQEIVKPDSAGEKYDAAYAFHKAMLVETDMKDAKSAIGYWMKTLAEKAGYKIQSLIYDDLDSLIADAKKGKIDLIYVAPQHYLKLTNTVETSLACVPIIGGKKTRKYLLLVRSDSPYSNIRDLKGKKLAVLQENNISLSYLNTLLLKDGQKEAYNFFSDIVEKRKYSQAILSVFFGQADACVVADFSFNIITELNPQIGKSLKAIASSPEYVHLVACFRKASNENLKKLTLDAVFNFQNSNEGRQVLTLFKIEGLVPALASDITTIKSLMDEYEQLKKKVTH